MSDFDPPKQEKKHPVSALLFALLLFALIASLLFYQKNKTGKDKPYDEFNFLEAVGLTSKDQPFDLEKAGNPRTIGNIEAPVKISEYSSFTCGACGLFHKGSYEKIKKEYIDTGKAYLVFNDIPRNVEDVSISAVAQCLPDNAYFTFLDLVFETQETWMAAEKPLQDIKEKMVTAGMSIDVINQCFKSEKLREKLVKKARKALKKHEVKQTPTLVINDKHLLMGLDPYEKIRDTIEAELAKDDVEEIETYGKKVEAVPENKDNKNDSVALVTEQGSADDETSQLVLEVVDLSEQAIPEPKSLNNIESSAGEEADQDILDIKSLAEPRIVGNPNAPLKISEYSSYTCGACASFHLDSFSKLKEEYIDTGKAYLVFDDFPRNNIDMTIGAIARCVPEDAYFKFVELVFKTQETWMRNKDPVDFVKQNAKLAGADSSMIDKCAKSKELMEALALRGQNTYENLGVNSTPTVIINDDKRLVGSVPYSQFKRVLEAELIKANK